MAEQTAGVMICCMPPAAVVFKSIKGPLLSLLSSAGEHSRRLTGFSRTRIHSVSDSNLKDAQNERVPESFEKPSAYRSSSRAWHAN